MMTALACQITYSPGIHQMAARDIIWILQEAENVL
jgi:hypothetical protein